MKNLKLMITVALVLGSFVAAFSQQGVDTASNKFNKGVNQNPALNDQNINNQNINNSNQNRTLDYNRDLSSPGQNAPSDLELNKEDSISLYKKGGSLINTDSTTKYPVNNPSRKTMGGTNLTQ
jgi:hypothetical protein